MRNSEILRIPNGQHFIYIRNSNYLGDDIKSQFVLFLIEDLEKPNKIIPIIPLYNRYLDLSGGVENFWQDKEETFFHYGYNDTIYQFSNNRLIHKYHVDFGNKISITALGLIKERNEAIKVIADDNYSRIGGRAFINDKIIYLDYDYQKNNHKYVMNRDNKKVLNYRNLLADIDTINIEPYLLENDIFISFVDPLHIISNPDEFVKCGMKREFISQLHESQNPVIFYYSYKF